MGAARSATALALLTLVWLVDGKVRTARPRRELAPPEAGPTDEMIWDSGLLEKALSAATLYEKGQQYYRDVTIKRFKGNVLGYVTPWHKKGYENAVLFRAKLTHVAPVWYQLKRKEQVYLLEGGHEYNQTWIDEVRAPAHPGAGTGDGDQVETATKLVPRVIIEFESAEDHVSLVQDPKEVIELITKEVDTKDYDGIVLEVWMTWTHMNAMANEQFVAAALAFIRQLHTRLRGADLNRPRQLILAVPPLVPQSYGRPNIDKKHMQDFSPFVDFWSLMTYDYALGGGPQPNSPLTWLGLQTKLLLPDSTGKKAMDRACSPEQALMGVNFYGYDFHRSNEMRPEAILGPGVLEIIGKQQPAFVWDEDEAEHSFEYKALNGKHKVYFPTPRSLEVRLEAFSKLGLGVSIWELGQGLDCFFDLL